jgi:tripeptidyl-peptidase I
MQYPETMRVVYAQVLLNLVCTLAICGCRLNGLSLGARGTSILFGSGDGGVGDGNPDPTTQICITNDGTNRTRFIASFPSSCPL